MLTFWVAVAKAEGRVEITASNSDGERGNMTLTVGSAVPAAQEAPASRNSASLTDNLEIRQEMIRLINQTRKANGLSELPVSEALMNAANGNHKMLADPSSSDAYLNRRTDVFFKIIEE